MGEEMTGEGVVRFSFALYLNIEPLNVPGMFHHEGSDKDNGRSGGVGRDGGKDGGEEHRDPKPKGDNQRGEA